MIRYTDRAIIIVAADRVVAANGMAKQVDTRGGERTFTVGLSPTGSEPATHRWCSWAMLPEENVALRGLLTALEALGRVHIFDGNTTTPEAVLTQLGLKRVQSVVP